MAKSARASVVKRNNRALKKKVFGPVETARNERLSAKLLELAQQPKPPRGEMDVEQAADDAPTAGSKEDDKATEDVDMDAENATTKPTVRSNKAVKREKANKAAKIEKKRHRKVTNRIAFAKHPKKGKTGKE